MTVSIPLAGFNTSGGVKTLVLLANAMVDRGWTVRIVVPDYASQSVFEVRRGVERRVIATPRQSMFRIPVYYVRLAWHAAHGADVCLANFYLTAYCAVLSKLTSPRVRIVYFLQGDEAESHGRLADAGPVSRFVRHVLARLSYRLPVDMICVSRWLQDRIGRPDSLVVGQGLDLDLFAPQPRDDRTTVVIGSIGSPSTAKGYPDFCRAVGKLPQDVRSRIRVLVAAGAPLALPDGLVAERVEAASESAMAAFYNRCDVFVFASRSEGFGLPPLEAMACGCAVVTTDCGGVRDYVQPDVNAVVVRPADAEALAVAIARLATDGALRQRIGAAGVATARLRGRDKMIAEFLDALVSSRCAA